MSSADALSRAFREEAPAVLATLTRRVGDLGLAEDALQDALADAAATWPRDGVPRRPGAWLTTAAHHRALDRLRRDRGLADRLPALAELAEGAEHEENDGVDDRLRLLFTCCHPALAMEARVALTLKALGGLTTAEVARGFLVAEPAMAQRIVRAKRKIAVARIAYRVPPPEELPERVAGVLAVVYLVFTEGHTASGGDALMRGELCDEAIRLARLLAELLPDEPEVHGLLALLLLVDARRPARLDEDGALVPLDEQDRTRWDAARLRDGEAALARAAGGGGSLALPAGGPYVLQAAIAAVHGRACDAASTDWPAIAALYAALGQIAPSPVVDVNHAVALAFAGRLDEARRVLDGPLQDPRLGRYVPLHAAHAELLRRAGDREGALAALDRAIALCDNRVEREALQRRREKG